MRANAESDMGTLTPLIEPFITARHSFTGLSVTLDFGVPERRTELRFHIR